MSANPKLLIVDDDADMRFLLQRPLRAEGYAVIEASDGMQALELMVSERPALVLLDVKMPGLSGFEVVKRMRAEGLRQPVLMVTSCNEVEQRVQGLRAGADDYLSSFYDPRELVARVQALLRRAEPVERSRILRLGPTTVDLTAKCAERDGAPLALTRTEFAILGCLADAHGRPVTREQLLGAVWGYESGMNTRTVETHVWRLRKKICEPGTDPRWLVNRSGLGYVLLVEDEARLELAAV